MHLNTFLKFEVLYLNNFSYFIFIVLFNVFAQIFKVIGNMKLAENIKSGREGLQ